MEKNKDWNILKELKFKIILLDEQIAIIRGGIKRAILIRKHCHKGFHLIEKNFFRIEKRSPGKRKTSCESHFFYCTLCGIKIFLTDKDKKNYDKLNKMENNAYNELFKSMESDSKNKISPDFIGDDPDTMKEGTITPLK